MKLPDANMEDLSGKLGVIAKARAEMDRFESADDASFKKTGKKISELRKTIKEYDREHGTEYGKLAQPNTIIPANSNNNKVQEVGEMGQKSVATGIKR